jgi:NAD(P)-dependent dehydrogenase (short-subunit alcohol dehydrogenase family)
MTRSMATELVADNIRANSIIAGFTASKSVLNHPTMMEKIRLHTLNARMIKRDMTPDDLCGTVRGRPHSRKDRLANRGVI